MKTVNSMLFVSPWRGIIGPNVGLAQLVAEAGARGVEAHVACPARDAAAEELERQGAVLHVIRTIALTPRSMSPVTLAASIRRGMRSARTLAELARRVGAGVICINSENTLMAPRAGTLAGLPVVAIVRGLRFAELGLAGRAYFKLQQRWVTRYVALNELGAKLLAGKGIRREKIDVIPNGVDTRVFAPGPRDPALAEALRVGPEDLVIGSVSHLTARKGVHHLIEAVGKIAAKLPALKCLILGEADVPADREYADGLLRRIAELGLTDRVRILGYRDDVPEMLKVFDVMVLPSETENCPRSVLEAQAAGRPVVGFRVGGMPEVVADGDSGVLIDPFDVVAMADALGRLLSDAPTLAAMGQAGRRRVMERFDLQTNLGRLMDLLVEQADVAAGREEAACRE